MFYRTEPTHTLSTIDELLPQGVENSLIDIADVHVDLLEDRSISWQSADAGRRNEVPISEEGIAHLCRQLKVPAKFIDRQDDEFKQMILDGLISRVEEGKLLSVRHNATGLLGFSDVTSAFVPFERIVDVARHVLPAESEVVDFSLDDETLKFDLVVPVGFDQGVGGDRGVTLVGRNGNPMEGDLTAGGLSFLYDYGKGRAPALQAFLYRMFCTNGMHMKDDTLKLDARGLNVDEIIEHMEALAQQAFAGVESDIASFYAMREDRPADSRQAMLRLAEENGLSDRVAVSLANRLASVDNPSMFDIVNLVTNAANDPTLSPGVRQNLQAAGGRVITDHAERCVTCQTRL